MQLPHITFIQPSKHLQIFTSTPSAETFPMLPIYAAPLRGGPPCCYCSRGKTSLSIWRPAFAPSIVSTGAKIGPGWAEVPACFTQQVQKHASALSVKEGDLCPLWAETRQMLDIHLGLTLGSGMQCLLVSMCNSWLS